MGSAAPSAGISARAGLAGGAWQWQCAARRCAPEFTLRCDPCTAGERGSGSSASRGTLPDSRPVAGGPCCPESGLAGMLLLNTVDHSTEPALD